ncbi:MAG: chloride channel protein [Deltaproteobacteria bacterium]|nr:MAG: chloride channel protein [Deltaproteobacteria bacterium]
MLVAGFVGLLGGFGAVGFRFLIEFFQGLFFGGGGNLLEVARSLPWLHKLLAPALGGLIIGPIIYFFAREAKGHGVPEVMEAVALREGRIRPRVVAIKSIASSICIGSGGSVGREGPIVQIGSAIGSVVGQILKLSGERIKILVGCGAAAGIAATFNAPLAGAMFSSELILKNFQIRTFSPIILSSILATVVSRLFFGNQPVFAIPIPDYSLVSLWEILPYTVLGCLAALVSLAFIFILYKSEDIFDKLRFPGYLKASIGGVIIGLIGIYYPHIFGVGYGSIELALEEGIVWYFLLLLIVLKLVAVSITIGSGGSGGVFAPSLFLGSMMGGLFGIAVHSLFPAVTASSGSYALVGMAAVVAGTTHAPITAILILFEMTNDYNIFLPLIVASATSALLAIRLKRESIYTMKLIRRGIDLQMGTEVSIMRSLRVKDVMEMDIDTIYRDMPLGEIRKLLLRSRSTFFPVIDRSGKLTGVISFGDLRSALFEEELEKVIIAEDLAIPHPVTVFPSDNLYDALHKMHLHDIARLPVVSRFEPDKLIGVLSRSDVLAAYDNEITKLRGVFGENPPSH